MRVRALVAYDGTDYSGFQRQANAPTVQETLEEALAQITQETVSIVAAGRTDAGVHAEGQVIAFDASWRHEPQALRRALNAVLPRDIAIREVREAQADFHPRYDAVRRCYRYSLYNAPVRCPLNRRFRLHIARPLDVELMQRAAQALVGEHDFATFGRPPQGSVTIRRIFRAEWRDEAPDLAFEIEGNAFLYRMVRSIVGALLLVGQGRMSIRAFEAAFASRERGQAGPTAPPHGLCLVEVIYEEGRS